MEKITSKANEKIKFAALLSQSAQARREHGLFLLEGARLCADAAASAVEIEQAFFTPEALAKYADAAEAVIGRSKACFEITGEISARLSETRTAQGLFCVCKMLDKAENGYKMDMDGKYIALENIQDPSNLGAICRTAEALGITGLIAAGGCDIYNPKALRAAMGSSLRLPILQTGDLPSLLLTAKENGMLTLASTVSPRAVPIGSLPPHAGVVCVIGNEGAGIGEETAKACAASVTIPMKGRAQSLNAAVSAAILMWELTR